MGGKLYQKPTIYTKVQQYCYPVFRPNSSHSAIHGHFSRECVLWIISNFNDFLCTGMCWLIIYYTVWNVAKERARVWNILNLCEIVFTIINKMFLTKISPWIQSCVLKFDHFENIHRLDRRLPAYEGAPNFRQVIVVVVVNSIFPKIQKQGTIALLSTVFNYIYIQKIFTIDLSSQHN
jgi:hypothetical protein